MAEYIYNAIPGSHHEIQPLSPDERFYGKKTNINHLQIFGSICFIKIMVKAKDHTPKAEEGIFVGYSAEQPLCYKVFLSGPPPRVKLSTHVTFLKECLLTDDVLQIQSCVGDSNTPSPLVTVQASAEETASPSGIIPSVSTEVTSSVEDYNSLETSEPIDLQPIVLSDTNVPSRGSGTSKSDQLTSEDTNGVIGRLFRDDEDTLIYKVLSVYKYRGHDAVTRGLVLQNGNVQKVNDPIWLGDAKQLIDNYEKECSIKNLSIILPNL